MGVFILHLVIIEYTIHTYFLILLPMDWFFILIVIAIFVIPLFVRIVKQGSLGMIETLGRFSRIALP